MPTNWARYDCAILEKFPAYRLEDLDQLTMPEYALLLEWDPSDPQPMDGRGQAMAWDDIDREIAAYNQLTPRQKLERAAARM